MQFLNSKSIVVLVLMILAVGACGPKIIKGKSPFFSIASMTLAEKQLSAKFTISNPNGEPMVIDGIDVRVEVKGAVLTRYDNEFELAIASNGTEEISVDQLPNDFTRDLLNSVESGELISLPFKLEGSVHTEANGNMRFRNKGHLYPVPGRPGHFRSATTHSSKIDSEDPFREIKDKN
jgi:LEA14-like dessication related protein